MEKPPFLMDGERPTVLHVGYAPATVEAVYRPHAELIGDIGANLAALADRLEGRLPNAAALLPLREGILAAVGAGADDDRFPPTPQRIVCDVRAAVPADGIVC